jgi:hypothetical protein
MFVRWKRMSRAGGYSALRAQLVRCERINGQPRQRVVIANLGVIWETATKVPSARRAFWRDLAHLLDSRADLIDAELRERIEASIAKRVRRITPAEARKLQAEDREGLRESIRGLRRVYRGEQADSAVRIVVSRLSPEEQEWVKGL